MYEQVGMLADVAGKSGWGGHGSGNSMAIHLKKYRLKDARGGGFLFEAASDFQAEAVRSAHAKRYRVRTWIDPVNSRRVSLND